jgi:hypothetical protein
MNLSDRQRWLLVATFAAAMAWVESAAVYYLRVMSDRIIPYQPRPLPISGPLGLVELVREAATLVMLLTLGMLAGGARRRGLGYTAIAFGIWDIFYYVFLRVITDWPASLFDWDILFLIPLPWWGPVIAPVTIALMMIVWGTLVTQTPDGRTSANWSSYAVGIIGIVIALYVFMADAIHTLPDGVEATIQLLPTAFNWPLFAFAVLLMGIPVTQIAVKAWWYDFGDARRTRPS